jgi:hypothetical protein
MYTRDIYIVVNHHHHSSPELVSSCKTLNSNSPPFLAILFSVNVTIKNLIWINSYSIWPFVTSLFHLVQCL